MRTYTLQPDGLITSREQLPVPLDAAVAKIPAGRYTNKGDKLSRAKALVEQANASAELVALVKQARFLFANEDYYSPNTLGGRFRQEADALLTRIGGGQ